MRWYPSELLSHLHLWPVISLSEKCKRGPNIRSRDRCEENGNYEVPSDIIMKLIISPQAMWSIINRVTKKKRKVKFTFFIFIFFCFDAPDKGKKEEELIVQAMIFQWATLSLKNCKFCFNSHKTAKEGTGNHMSSLNVSIQHRLDFLPYKYYSIGTSLPRHKLGICPVYI